MKLRVSRPGDESEREADRLADEVMAARAPEAVPSAPSAPKVAAAAHGSQPLVLPRSAERDGQDSRPGAAPRSVVPPTGGEPLPAPVRAFFEPRFGRDLGGVRVHADARAAESAEALKARAYAFGSDVVFGAGQFSPGTRAGDRLIAHELAHVVRGGGEPVVRRNAEQPLDIEVPDPEDASPAGIKYPWQNPALRESIYPFRDEQLAFFLRTYMEIDLDDPKVAAKMKTLTVEELKAERLTLSEDLADVKAELKEAEKAKDAQRARELYVRKHRLEEDLEYLPKPSKKDVLPKDADKKWAAYQYSKYDDAGSLLTHDQLLARILDRFDADTTFTRYPKWLRYMVVHFSGMRYKSAHGSYAPATELVRRLKREQVKSEMGAAPEPDVAEFAKQAVTDVESELTGADKPARARASTLKTRLAALKAVETERAGAFTKKGQETQRAAFAELAKLEDERDDLKSRLDAKVMADAEAEAAQKRLDEIDPLIKAAEAKIDSKSLAQVRKRVDAAEGRRRAAVIEHELEKAEAALKDLDDTQAVAVLKTMRARGAFPDWVWRELVRATALKLETGEGEDWEKVTPEEAEAKKQKDPVTKRWRQIMAEWQKDVTGWRAKHGKDLSLVVIRAVCNEIAEMSLHARGVKPAGGISQKARWYASKASGGTFSRPKSGSDLKPGASLFFLEWSDKPPKDAVSVVHSDTVELQNEKGEVISNGFKDTDGRTYQFNADKKVTRLVPIGSTADPSIAPPMGTQYLNWTHEAQVVEVDAKRGRVVTFETGPIGLRTRWLKNVVGVWNVYVGFAPSASEPANIDEYLKGILPGR